MSTPAAWMLVLAGGLVGGAVGASAVLLSTPAAEPGEADRVAALERRIEELEGWNAAEPTARAGIRIRRPRAADGDEEGQAVGGTAAAEPEPDAAENADLAAIAAVRERLGDEGATAEAIRAVITDMRSQRETADRERRHRKQHEQLDAELKRHLAPHAEDLGLDEQQLAQVREVAHLALTRRHEGEDAGAPREELAAVDRDAQRQIRDIMGPSPYREFRKLEIDRRARPTIADVANRAGVDAEQRRRIEGLLSSHIEGLVDTEIRIRTEELPQPERAALHEQMQTANRSAWDRLRDDILDDEQRKRVPKRLR